MDEKTVERQLLSEFEDTDIYERLYMCDECQGAMVYKGVGEYQCERCGKLAYDDYGKVRNYIEKHQGATAAMASRATGVSQRKIREMIKESRLEIAPTSKMFLRCEICGTSLRAGRLCPQCEANYHRGLAEQTKAEHKKNFAGYSMEKPVGEEGAKRFTRDR